MIAAVMLVAAVLGVGFVLGVAAMVCALGGCSAVSRLMRDEPELDPEPPADERSSVRLVWSACESAPSRRSLSSHGGSAA